MVLTKSKTNEDFMGHDYEHLLTVGMLQAVHQMLERVEGLEFPVWVVLQAEEEHLAVGLEPLGRERVTC